MAVPGGMNDVASGNLRNAVADAEDAVGEQQEAVEDEFHVVMLGDARGGSHRGKLNRSVYVQDAPAHFFPEILNQP